MDRTPENLPPPPGDLTSSGGSGKYTDLLFRILFCVCLVLAFCCAWQAVTVKSEPRDALVASPNVRQVGTVRQGKSVGAEFELRNASSYAIDIVSIKHTCSCTTHSPIKMGLEPDEVVKFTMSMDTKYRRSTVAASSFIEYCKRDGKKKSHYLVVQMAADVDPDYDVKPKEIVFQKGEPATRELHFVLRHLKSLNIVKVECDGKCFSANVIGRNGRLSKGVSVAYDPMNDRPDDVEGMLTIHTDCTNQPIIGVPLILEQ
jgi:Protein of unknown function (DUF1573)